MSKKLKKYLEKLGIENIDEVIAEINKDDDSEEIIDKLLSGSQSYSKPFLEADFKAKFDTERKTLKGKYFKDAAQKLNKIFGNKLTNKEIEDIIADPENEGKTYDAVAEAVKEKVSDKTGASETELQKMLDLSNGKVSELEKQITDKEAAHKKDLADAVGKIKLDTVLNKKLTELMPKFTSMNPVKAAELIIEKIGKKAFLKLADNDSISLHELADIEKPLKKSDTQLQTFEGLVGDIAKEYELPVAKSPAGTEKGGNNTQNNNNNDEAPAPLKNAEALAHAFEIATANL